MKRTGDNESDVSLIKKHSPEWDAFIETIEGIKRKSNRQVLCVRCWLLLNYEQKIKHLKTFEDHESFILTSSKFASAWQISSLAMACKKLRVLPDGEYIVSPFQESSALDTNLGTCKAKTKAAEKSNENNAISDSSPKSILNSTEPNETTSCERMAMLNQSLARLQGEHVSLKAMFADLQGKFQIVLEENSSLKNAILRNMGTNTVQCPLPLGVPQMAGAGIYAPSYTEQFALPNRAEPLFLVQDPYHATNLQFMPQSAREIPSHMPKPEDYFGKRLSEGATPAVQTPQNVPSSGPPGPHCPIVKRQKTDA